MDRVLGVKRRKNKVRTRKSMKNERKSQLTRAGSEPATSHNLDE